MESTKYQAFCLDDPAFFDTPERLVDDDTRFEHSLRPAPPGWRRSNRGLWAGLTADQAALPPQGWKIHISVTLDAMDDVLTRVWDYCVTNRLAFKFLRSRAAVLAINAKDGSRGSSGKLITIYPRDDDQFAQVLPGLSSLLRGFIGPYVLSDLRYSAGPIYVRYGAFAEMYCTGDDGEPIPALYSVDGTLVPDLRGPIFSMPPWVGIPEILQESLNARLSDGQIDFPYDVEKALHFSNGGGVYLATDRNTGDHVILREARPHAGLDVDGGDAVARLERERAILERLSGLDCIPRIIGQYVAWEHHFLVEEYIEGETLLAAVINRYPFVHPEPTAQAVDDYQNWATSVMHSVEVAINAVHQRGIRFGDLHPGNVMVRPDGRVSLIDFEVSTEIDEPRGSSYGAPGFIAPRWASGSDIDRYALESLRLFTLLPLNQLIDRDRDKAGTLVDAAAGLFPTAPRLPTLLLSRSSLGDQRRASTCAHTDDRFTTTPDWPTIRDCLVAGIHASATPDRTDRMFPGDPQQFVTGGISLRTGAAGVILALDQVGEHVPTEYIDWLTRSARLGHRHVRRGYYDGLHGVAMVLERLGYIEDALEMLELAHAEQDEATTAGILGGGAGIAMTLLHFADRTGDDRYLNSADQIAEDLAALLGDTGVKSSFRPPSKAGLMRGMSGPAILFIHQYERTGIARYLDLAAAALRRDLDHCIEAADGTYQVKDGLSQLAYVDGGSAGIAVALHGYLRHREDEAFAHILDQILRACHASYVLHPGLFRGRAGFIAVLSQIGRLEDRAVVLDHTRRLGWHALSYNGHLTFPGNTLQRISMDLATGSAGILLALGAAFEESAVTLPLLIHRPAVATTASTTKGGDLHVVRP